MNKRCLAPTSLKGCRKAYGASAYMKDSKPSSSRSISRVKWGAVRSKTSRLDTSCSTNLGCCHCRVWSRFLVLSTVDCYHYSSFDRGHCHYDDDRYFFYHVMTLISMGLAPDPTRKIWRLLRPRASSTGGPHALCGPTPWGLTPLLES